MLILTALVIVSHVPLEHSRNVPVRYKIHEHVNPCALPSSVTARRKFFQAYHEHLIKLFLLQGHGVSATPMFDPENNCHCLGSPKNLERVN
jgi:hypothetical protein